MLKQNYLSNKIATLSHIATNIEERKETVVAF
jgi:hypothetical protein